MADTPSFDQLPSAVSDLQKDVNWIKRFLQQNEGNGPAASRQDKFLTISEAAEFLNLAKQTMYGLVSRKLIPVMKRNKRLYFSQLQLQKWIESGRIQTKDEIAAMRPILIRKGGKK